MRRSPWLTILGFGLVFLGFTAIFLNLVGIRYAFLTWLDAPGRTFGFALRLLLIIVGFVLLAIAQTDWDKERREIENGTDLLQ